MTYRNDFDLSTITAAVVVMSDRVLSGERPNGAGEACRDRLLAEGLGDVSLSVVPELAQSLDEELRAAITAGRRLVVVLGGAGLVSAAGYLAWAGGTPVRREVRLAPTKRSRISSSRP